MAEVDVIINGPALAELLRGGDGPVMRRMMVLGETVKVRTVASLKQGFVRDWLGPRITKRVVSTSDGAMVQVGATNAKTKAHEIAGKNRDDKLLFFDNASGQLISIGKVKHPGSDFTNPTKNHPEPGGYLGEKLNAALLSIRGQI